MISNSDYSSLLTSIAEFTERLAHDPRSSVFVPLSEAYQQLGMASDALEVARRGVQSLPGFGPGHTLLGRLLAEKGDIAGAVTSFERALSIDDQSLPALKGLARIRYQQGEHDAARHLLLKVLALKPDDSMVRKTLASLPPQAPGAVANKASDPAVVKKDTAPISTPTIAEIYERQGLLQRALGVYRDLLQKDPTNQGLLQKYRDLKTRINAGASKLSPPPTVDPPASETAEPKPPVVLAPQAVTTEFRVIQSLECLLEAVRRRREYVR
jgi:tetratricopeptide (TPR) repeat protein